MSKKQLYTIGYEGRNISDFIGILIENGITKLVDVREVPLSRKKGFSKSALQSMLNQNGIEYVHLKQLGSPKNLRNKLKEDFDYDYFFSHFEIHLKKNAEVAESDLNFHSKKPCLMCFEKDYTKCHRKVVAEYLNKISGGAFHVIHK